MDRAVRGAEVLRATTKKVVNYFEEKMCTLDRSFRAPNVKSWLRAWFGKQSIQPELSQRRCGCVHNLRITARSSRVHKFVQLSYPRLIS